MGRRPRAAAVACAMRHEVLAHRGGDARRPSPASCGMGLLPTGVRRPPGLRGTVPWRRDARPHGGTQSGPTPFGHIATREAWGQPSPPACGALWRVAQLGKRARATPRQVAGGLRRGPQASAWGLAARKDAVWAEGLADGTPWARPGHHQAASCGLRRCRELRVRSPARVPLSKGSMGIPSSCLAARQQGIGCSEC